MTRLTPLLFGVAAATAFSLSPIDFGPLPIPAGIETAEAAASVSINIFFQPLASHGIWVKHAKYRYVFCPKVDAKWRPYSHGHWIYLKGYGWYFASDEPFAWAVYHYGRWFHEARLGWCWVPGNAWAGAWVAWRRSNDFVGWAPLPPTREGFVIDVDISSQEPPQTDWIFIPPKRFLEPRLDVAVVFGDQQPDVFQKTQFLGPVVVQNNIVVNTKIDVNFIQQQTNTKVVVVEPKPVDQPTQAAAEVSGNSVAVFAPQITKPKQDEAPKQAVSEDEAAQKLGNASEAPASSASSEQPSSGASSSEASSASASGASSASVSEASSASASSAETSSASASSAEASSAPASSAASSAASSSVSSEPASSMSSSSTAPASSSEAPASSSKAPLASSSAELSSSAAPESSSKAPVSSEEAASSAPASSERASSSEAASSAASSEAAPASSLECPEGYQIVKGKCVPIESSAAESSAAQ